MNRDLGSDQAYGNAAGLLSVIPGAIAAAFRDRIFGGEGCQGDKSYTRVDTVRSRMD
jgi:hypothetical protein